MAASKTKSIKDAMVSILSAIELDDEPAFVAVKDHPRGEFDEWPSVRVLPADQPNEKGSMGQNDRTPTFMVRTYVPATNEGTEFDQMYVLTDLILDALDEADFNNSLNEIDQTIGSYMLNATRASWFDSDSQAGPILICDINVEVTYSKDLSSGLN